jgi:hypothetical protein
VRPLNFNRICCFIWPDFLGDIIALAGGALGSMPKCRRYIWFYLVPPLIGDSADRFCLGVIADIRRAGIFSTLAISGVVLPLHEEAIWVWQTPAGARHPIFVSYHPRRRRLRAQSLGSVARASSTNVRCCVADGEYGIRQVSPQDY